MSTKNIEIKGVWTAEEVKQLKNWMQGKTGATEIQRSHDLALEQSKKIQKIAYVEMERLKIPFTFTR